MESVGEDAVFLEHYFKRITDDATKLHLLYELNWRLDISATPKNLDWFIGGIEDLAKRLTDFSAEDKKMLLSLTAQHANASLRFYNVAHDISGLKFKANAHISVDTFYRLFVPRICKEYDKVLYKAFRKYGIENFDFEIIEECIDKDFLNAREIY